MWWYNGFEVIIVLIYKATNTITGKCYIGQTVKTLDERRLRHHDDYTRGTGFKFHDALRSYGWDVFTWEVIDTAQTTAELHKKEAYWIAKCNSIDNGYNMTHGGESNPMDCSVTIEKHRKQVQGDIFRSKVSATLKSYRAENAFSADHKQMLSVSAMGNTNGLSQATNIEQYDLNGNYMQTFISQSHAARWVKENTTFKAMGNHIGVRAKCGGQAYGYLWKKLED